MDSVEAEDSPWPYWTLLTTTGCSWLGLVGVRTHLNTGSTWSTNSKGTRSDLIPLATHTCPWNRVEKVHLNQIGLSGLGF